MVETFFLVKLHGSFFKGLILKLQSIYHLFLNDSFIGSQIDHIIMQNLISHSKY